MFDLDNVVYPGNILNQVVAFDPPAWDEITAHADRLFEKQKQLRYWAMEEARASHLFTRLKNFAVRSYNEAVRGQKELYLRPAVDIYGSVSGIPSPQIMTPNMTAGLLAYVEQNRERLIEGEAITGQDILDLRIFINPTRKPGISPPAKNI